MNQVQQCVDEAGTEFKPGRLSELYLKNELENILQSPIPSSGIHIHFIFGNVFLSIGIKYTINS